LIDRGSGEARFFIGQGLLSSAGGCKLMVVLGTADFPAHGAHELSFVTESNEVHENE